MITPSLLWENDQGASASEPKVPRAQASCNRKQEIEWRHLNTQHVKENSAQWHEGIRRENCHKQELNRNEEEKLPAESLTSPKLPRRTRIRRRSSVIVSSLHEGVLHINLPILHTKVLLLLLLQLITATSQFGIVEGTSSFHNQITAIHHTAPYDSTPKGNTNHLKAKRTNTNLHIRSITHSTRINPEASSSSQRNARTDILIFTPSPHNTGESYSLHPDVDVDCWFRSRRRLFEVGAVWLRSKRDFFFKVGTI